MVTAMITNDLAKELNMVMGNWKMNSGSPKSTIEAFVRTNHVDVNRSWTKNVQRNTQVHLNCSCQACGTNLHPNRSGTTQL
mmetsp:Transcript_4889/g.13922  ORF Transcript_4889/g.13922 Transcript_4889/m.13922 type:complete len:81 (-) Transcript_4889:230-472(-)